MARDKRALGKGLGALIPGAGESPTSEPEAREILKLSPAEMRPSPWQPRKDFDPEGLLALADSIREHGVVQPIVVRTVQNGYEIIAGERRWRAAKMAELKKVPVRVIEADDTRVMELSLVENLQREDLSPLEAASGIQDLIQKFSLTQEQAAKRLGWSRVAVTNKLRLLQLPASIQEMLHKNSLSEGHARALLSLHTEEDKAQMAQYCLQKGLSVRELEEAVRKTLQGKPAPRPVKKPGQNVLIPEPVLRVSERYGIDVKMTGKGQKVKVQMSGLTEDEAMRLFEMIDSEGELLFKGK
ncbi:MAG: ParB/RepB/Spo0J family partition protein [Synergistota bacterium]|nr:ParB/RepB/Spo0J family partition protein [Synergistota bacterium]